MTPSLGAVGHLCGLTGHWIPVAPTIMHLPAPSLFLLDALVFIFHVYVCLRVCGTSVGACVWRPEIDAGGLPQLLSTLY